MKPPRLRRRRAGRPNHRPHALTFSISEGLALGFAAYAAFMAGTGRAREVTAMAWALAALFMIHLLLR